MDSFTLESKYDNIYAAFNSIYISSNLLSPSDPAIVDLIEVLQDLTNENNWEHSKYSEDKNHVESKN